MTSIAKLLREKAPYLLIAAAAVAACGALTGFGASRMLEKLYAQGGFGWGGDLLLYSQVFVCALGAMLIVESRRLRAEIGLRRQAEEKAELLSQRDPLTGLANRRHVSLAAPMIAAEAQREGRMLAALLIDLDRLKPVNDTLGHAAGDKMIRTVASRIQQGSRKNALVARIGGDEFAVVFSTMRDRAAEVADRMAHRLLSGIAKPLILNDTQQIEISASIGVAISEPEGDIEELLRHADQAMYCAKNNGRNQVAHFDEALGELMRQRAALETDMLRALHHGEFVPFFHPLVDLRTRRISGFEVLARWRHPQRGLIQPVEFVPIAEETGMIGELSESVLRQACRRAKEWDPELTMAFNVSPLQFKDKDLAARIEKVLIETDFPAHRLEIELTENAIILDLEAARETVAALKATGVRIALDDFGTGYSSLSSLRQLPFDKVKIDRSFVTDAPNDEENTKIVEGILGLTRSLGLTTTAEGIESSEEESWLRGLGCEQGQGYLFSRPMSADEVAMRLDALTEQASVMNADETEQPDAETEQADAETAALG